MPRVKDFINIVRGENRLEVRAEADETHIYLSGAVGKSWYDDSGITEKEVRDALKATKKGKPVHVHVNSEGGSVQEGLGIYNAIKERSKDVTAHVDGYALSIASVFPLAAGRVVSPKSAIWMIHNAWAWAQGNADDMRKQADMLETHDAMLSEIYAEHTGKSKEEIRTMMKAETWVRGSEAVDFGLADEGDAPDDTQAAAYRPLPQAWLDRCANIPANILDALRVPAAAAMVAPESSTAPTASPSADTTPADQRDNTAAAKAGGTQTKDNTMPEVNAPAAATPTAPDAMAKLDALNRKIIKNRVESYVTAQKITKSEVPIFVTAALENEEGTFAILDAKQSQITAQAPVGSGVEVNEFAPTNQARGNAEVLARYPAMRHATPKARYSALRYDWSQMIEDAIRQDAVKNAPILRMGAMPVNSNTYSSTLVTAFLTEGATTILQNRWASLRAFSRDFSTDAYKPLAVAQHKYVTVGPTVQTDATSFESGDATVAPITITPHQYTSSINVSNSDLNSGLRMENLTTIAAAKLANKVIEAATAPITLANFATKADSADGTNVITAANFTFADLAVLWGKLQKASVKNIIMDGSYLAKLLNQPTYFQQIAEGEGAYKAFGWDLIALNSDWTGASNNAAVFACDPQAIAVLAGLPLIPPAIPGNTLQQSVFTIPGVEMSVQTNSWFNLAARTAWMSYDVVFGAAKMDATAGVIIATA